MDFARFVEALTCLPGRVYVDQNGVRDPYTKEGLLQAVMSLEAATAETEIRGQRLRNWHWSRAVDGVPHSGPRPFGWQEDRITLHPVEASLVRKAIEDRTGGKAVGAIAKEWCDLGVRGTRGGTPNPQTVTQIITAPRVCGPLVDDAIERLLFPETGIGRVWLPASIRQRWMSGEMGFEEKRKVIASVFTCFVIRPGVKGNRHWDYSRVTPVWKWADRAAVADPDGFMAG